jgi:hypothetical protein
MNSLRRQRLLRGQIEGAGAMPLALYALAVATFAIGTTEFVGCRSGRVDPDRRAARRPVRAADHAWYADLPGAYRSNAPA